MKNFICSNSLTSISPNFTALVSSGNSFIVAIADGYKLFASRAIESTSLNFLNAYVCPPFNACLTNSHVYISLNV